MILYYRAFYFEILKIPPTLFPPLLSKDDVIDSGLVLIVSSWIINLLAMRLCGRRTPSAASVKHFVDTCLNSLEITVLLSIAGQINLTIYSLEDIEEKGWLGCKCRLSLLRCRLINLLLFSIHSCPFGVLYSQGCRSCEAQGMLRFSWW